MVATRVTGSAPRIDGALDDPAWCAAEAVGDFVQSRPAPGALAVLPSSARVLYDDDAVYVAVRLWDPHPDSIVAPFPRRDDETTSDWLFVEMDTRFDHRSGYSFGVNPRGVQVDGAWSNDVDYDAAWNGVWASASRIDSLGWTVELRIPFAQLPLSQGVAGAPLTWGINFYRYTPHRGEVSNWSPRLPSVVGVISHFNELHGLQVPPHAGHLEVAPYGAVLAMRPPGAASSAPTTAGADIRWRPSATTSVAVSVHPDFGQVEADPSQVNLTTFETFLPEQRPLFVEGADIFQFNSSLAFSSRGTSFSDESPFYSRRIGRAPHGGPPAGALSSDVPSASALLGAIRASGRSAGGWSGGLFNAWTGAEHASWLDSAGARSRSTVEPLTGYTVARAGREFAEGAGAIGAMGTFVNRPGLSGALDSMLPSTSWLAGSDFRRRFGGDRFEVTGFWLGSHVAGSAAAISALRRQPLHGYERPELSGPAGFDSTRTSLDGFSAQARVARIDGGLQWGVAARAVSRGFESNDVGFQRNADWLLAVLNWKYLHYQPGHLIRRWSVGSSQLGAGWTFEGERRATVANLSGSIDFKNFWGATVALDHEFGARDPEVLRGGPALLLPAQDRWTSSVYSDTRKRWQITLSGSGSRERGSHSHGADVGLDFSAFLTDRLQLGLKPEVGDVTEGWQYVSGSTDASGQARYLLGRLHQRTASLTARSTYAFSSRLTLQLYAQAFLSGGRYDGFAEVLDPGATDPASRVGAIAANRLTYDPVGRAYTVDAGSAGAVQFADPAFSDRDLHLNLVLRWEFLPGSSLFVVWTQRRLDEGVQAFDVGRDLNRLWRAPDANALQVKVTYWLAR